MTENHVDAGVRSFCVQRIGRSDYQVPGTCPECGESLYLVIPYGWRDRAGRPHTHDRTDRKATP